MNNPNRVVGVLLLLVGVAEFALLAFHPESHAHDFAGVLREEAANRVPDALVHGGFVVVLALQIASLAVLSLRLGNASAVFAWSLFAIGSAFLMGSVTIDGLIIPGVAARYTTASGDRLDAVRAVFAFAGAAIGCLMPMGLALQGLGIAAWGLAMAKTSRPAPVLAILLGLFGAGAVATSIATANPMLAMVGIVTGGLWAIVGGIWLLRTP